MAREELMRKSTGLTEAHKELIRLLAARAVADYLAEGKADESADDHEAVTR